MIAAQQLREQLRIYSRSLGCSAGIRSRSVTASSELLCPANACFYDADHKVRWPPFFFEHRRIAAQMKQPRAEKIMQELLVSFWRDVVHFNQHQRRSFSGSSNDLECGQSVTARKGEFIIAGA